MKASHAADNLKIEDFSCAERDISLAVSYLKSAASEFRKHQEMKSRHEREAEQLRASDVREIVNRRDGGNDPQTVA